MAIRILSLDDEPEMGELIHLILGRQGYDLVSCSDSYEAWATLHAEPFNLFMQDLSRPDVDGWEFCRAMKDDRALCDLPILIVSARARDLKALNLVGKIDELVDAYVTKPFGPRELLDAIGDVLRERGKSPLEERVADRWKVLKNSIEDCLAALRDPDASVRMIAVSALRWQEPRDYKGAVTGLMGALEDESHDVRMLAIRTLGYLKDRRAVDALAQLLDEDDEQVRLAAAKALGMIGSNRTVEPLTRMVGDKAWTIRCSAATALGRIGDARAMEPLFQVLEDEVCYVRMMAAVALGKIGDARATAPLLPLVEDTDGWVRQTAARALGQLGDPRAIEPLAGALYEQRLSMIAANSLAQIGAPAVVPLAEIMHAAQEGSVRSAAAWALGRIKGDSSAVEPLILALKDKHPQVRATAARSLGNIGHRRAVGPLVTALQDANETVRGASAGALGNLKDEEAVEPLAAALHDDVQSVRHSAAWALAVTGRRGKRLLVEHMHHSSALVREAAISAASPRRGERRQVLELLISALQDEDVHVRRAAARKLWFVEDKRTLDALIAALRDEDADVVRYAIEALRWLKDARAIPPLERLVQEDDRETEDGYSVADKAKYAIDRIKPKTGNRSLVKLYGFRGAVLLTGSRVLLYVRKLLYRLKSLW